MKIVLFVVLSLIGQQPRSQQIEAPSLEECWEQAEAFIDTMSPVAEQHGGGIQASCIVIFDKPTNS